MTDANYQKHFKVIGKLTYLYDTAVTTLATLEGYVSALYDQIWTGAQASYEAGRLLSEYAQQMDRAINDQVSGTTLRQTMAQKMLKAYIKSSLFTGDLENTPSDASREKAICEAFQQDLVDNSKTMSTETTTGMVNFMDEACGPTGGPSVGWNTEADATADYKDSVYVVEAQV